MWFFSKLDLAFLLNPSSLKLIALWGCASWPPECSGRRRQGHRSPWKTLQKGRDSDLSFKMISVHAAAAAASVGGWGGHSLLMQLEETSKSSVSVQDAAWLGWLGKIKSHCQLLDPRWKQLRVADYLLEEVADDWQLLNCSFIMPCELHMETGATPEAVASQIMLSAELCRKKMKVNGVIFSLNNEQVLSI